MDWPAATSVIRSSRRRSSSRIHSGGRPDDPLNTTGDRGVEALRRLGGRERLRYLGRGLKRLADIVAGRNGLRGAQGEIRLYAVTQANTLAFRRYERSPRVDSMVAVPLSRIAAPLGNRVGRKSRYLAYTEPGR